MLKPASPGATSCWCEFCPSNQTKTVFRIVGRGSMAIVYRADEPPKMTQAVALSSSSASWSPTGRSMERFLGASAPCRWAPSSGRIVPLLLEAGGLAGIPLSFAMPLSTAWTPEAVRQRTAGREDGDLVPALMPAPRGFRSIALMVLHAARPWPMPTGKESVHRDNQPSETC